MWGINRDLKIHNYLSCARSRPCPPYFAQRQWWVWWTPAAARGCSKWQLRAWLRARPAWSPEWRTRAPRLASLWSLLRLFFLYCSNYNTNFRATILYFNKFKKKHFLYYELLFNCKCVFFPLYYYWMNLSTIFLYIFSIRLFVRCNFVFFKVILNDISTSNVRVTVIY